MKLKNHQNYVVNKKREKNVRYPGALYNTTVLILRRIWICVLGRVGNFWSCSPCKVWSLQISLSRRTLFRTRALYRILGVGDTGRGGEGLVRGLEFFVNFHKPFSITTECVVVW